MIPVDVFGVWSTVGRLGLWESFVVGFSTVGVFSPVGEAPLGFGSVGSALDTSVLAESALSFGVFGVVVVSGLGRLSGLNLDVSVVVVSIFGRVFARFGVFGGVMSGVSVIPVVDVSMSGIRGVRTESVLLPPIFLPGLS